MDELLFESIELILSKEMATKSFLQRQLRIGYERASKLIDIIETMGIIGPEVINQKRQIYITLNEWLSIISKREINELNVHQDKYEMILNEIDEPILESNVLPINEIWRAISDQLRTELSENSYNKWFTDVKVKFTVDEMLMIAPNDFHKEIIQSRYTSLITHILKMFTDKNMSLKIVASKSPK